ncbi:MAG TPA: glutathione S-transferase N-terminal domain-containing protein [Thermoleophilaceae bacterium]|nr:glutathione S-transferase N-terminal domain-containing protein [Thermoleophilaceae bacterium]
MARGTARLYGMSISHPANAARLMLEYKGIPYELVRVSPGAQAVRVRLARFRGGTVPALAIDGRRALGTRAISRLLDELQPEPPLFPPDPDRRRAVEEAEAWGEQVLQPIPRRALRWALSHDQAARMTFSRAVGNPMPAVTSRAMLPVIAFYARRENAWSTDQIRGDWAALPGHVDHVDNLLAQGVLGKEQPNAADFQIGTTLRLMLASEDFAPLIAGRPAERLALRIWPEYRFPVPRLLPATIREAAA